MDCLLIGYHEGLRDENDLVGFDAELGEVPPSVSNLLRARTGIDGRVRSYLETLSHFRQDLDGGSLYTVAELPSLGTLYLVNQLRAAGCEAQYVNCFTFEQERLSALLAQDPAAVAVTTTFYMSVAPIIEIVDVIRSHHPTVPIVVGGPLVFNLCRDLDEGRLHAAFDRAGADAYIWDSQGEGALVAVTRALSEGRSLDGIPNVYCRDGGSWAFGGRVPEASDLDASAVDWLQFTPAELGPTVSLRTARSCAFRCAFCDYPQRAGALALASSDTVERELRALEALGVTRVTFVDDTFNVPVRRFKDLCRMMVRCDLGIEWFSYFRCGSAREPELYDLMYESGCRGVLLGIESGDDRVLRLMDKRATSDDYRHGIAQLKERGIFTHASLIAGFPGETSETIDNTIRFIDQSGVDTFTVNPWYYAHSTPVHARADALGLSGSGHYWTHSTMTSAQAIAAADRMFAEIVGSTWMPVNGLDFWGVPYLLGKGMTTGEVTRFLALARPLTLANRMRDPGAGQTADALADELRAFCGELSLSGARYRDVVAA
jgi:radical SAM PhpK family P-methyltransferase